MPGVSQNMKDSIGKTLTKVTNETMRAIESKIKKITDAGADSVEVTGNNLEELQKKLKDLKKRHDNLEVGGGNDKGGKDEGDKSYQILKKEIAAAQTSADKMSKRLDDECKEAISDAWKQKVVNKSGAVIDIESEFDKTMQGVLKKIVQAKGGGSHGKVKLKSPSIECLHWVSGSQRIFGSFDGGKLKLLGTGTHAGTDSTYNVNLTDGRKTTAETS
jgi:hypothetical protein